VTNSEQLQTDAADISERLLLHRRKFLGLLAAGGTTVALAACSSGGSTGKSDASNVSTTNAPTSAPRSGLKDLQSPQADDITEFPFALGVASGDPAPTSVVLWTKLITDALSGKGVGADRAVLWEMATDEDFKNIVARDLEPAPEEFANSVHVDVTNLEPATSYWYRFKIGSHTSVVGRTRTAPAEDAAVESLKIAFASCQLRTAGYWTAYPHMVSDEPDVVFFLGDYIYEYVGGQGDLAVPLDNEPQTLDDYRVVYGAYKRDQRIQDAHACAPWVLTWDDHEVENNHAGAIPEKDEDRAGFSSRRRAAYQAYWEHQPIRTDPPAEDGSLQMYRSLRWGTLAEFFVLDGRQYRTDQPCGDQVITSRSNCEGLEDENATMLGNEQEKWLIEGLKDSGAQWKVLAQQTVMKALVLGDLLLNPDQWDGYPAARQRLLSTIDENQISDVVVLTGDIHAAGAASLRIPDAGTSGKVVASEFVTTSISSPGFGAIVGDLDLTPLGLAYANFKDRGYGRATITKDSWVTQFVTVDTVKEPQSDAQVDATVTVKAGTPGVVRK